MADSDSTKLPTTYRAHALRDIGKLVRVLFFIATAIIFAVWVSTVDASIGERPLAELTLNMIVGVAFQALVAIVIARTWFAWAFTESEKAYEIWGGLGIVAILAVVIIALSAC